MLIITYFYSKVNKKELLIVKMWSNKIVKCTCNCIKSCDLIMAISFMTVLANNYKYVVNY